MPPESYQPREGSLPDRVCRYFAANPDEQLSQADIVIKFDATRAAAQTSLESAVASGLLMRTGGGASAAYKAGPKLGGWSRHAPAAPAPAVAPDAARSVFDMAAKAKRTRPHPIDLAAVVIRSDVPIPTRVTFDGVQQIYTQLLQRLQPGTSCELPERQALAFVRWCNSRAKHVKLERRKLPGGVIGIWRVA